MVAWVHAPTAPPLFSSAPPACTHVPCSLSTLPLCPTPPALGTKAGEVVPSSLADNLTRLIAEGTGEEDEAADCELRGGAVEAYLELLDKPKLPRVLLKVGGAG